MMLSIVLKRPPLLEPWPWNGGRPPPKPSAIEAATAGPAKKIFKNHNSLAEVFYYVHYSVKILLLLTLFSMSLPMAF